jgi:oligopeptide/dipeptide ABC transporter ATP-binding protein
MLDVSVRGALLNTMDRLRTSLGITFMFITHDLALARYFCDRVAVLFRGRVVEAGPTDDVITTPQHPYTQALIAAASALTAPPATGRHLNEPGTGCVYRQRCPTAQAQCSSEPLLRTTTPEHRVACHFPSRQQPSEEGTRRP